MSSIEYPFELSLKGLPHIPALDIRQLYYFVSLAEQGSISAAAAHLHLAQPSLSGTIMRLERKLGTQLVYRTGRGIVLTEAGNLLAVHARRLVAAAGRACQEVQQVGSQPRGRISIGLPPSLGSVLSVPLAETIQNEFPEIRLRITEGLSGDIADWVEDERLDLGYVYETRDGHHLLYEPLVAEKLFFASAPDNIPECVEFDASGHATLKASHLRTLPLAMPGASHGARNVVERFVRSSGTPLNVAIEIDSLPQIIAMVARASVYGILPRAAVIEEVAAGTIRLIEIVDPTMSRTSYMVRKRSRPISQGSREIHQAIRVIVRELIDRFELDADLLDEAVPPCRLSHHAERSSGPKFAFGETVCIRAP